MERNANPVAWLILILAFLGSSMLVILLDSIKSDTKACHDFVRALSVAVEKDRAP